MTYGFRSINDSGIFQIDGVNPNLQELASYNLNMGAGTLPVFPNYAEGVLLSRAPYKITLAKYQASTRWCIADPGGEDALGDNLLVTTPTIPDPFGTQVDVPANRAQALLLTVPERNALVKVFTFSFAPEISPGYGLKIFSGSGDDVYSTNRANLRISETVPVDTNIFGGNPYTMPPANLTLNIPLANTYFSPPYVGINTIMNWVKLFSSGANLETFRLAFRCTTTTLSIRLIRDGGVILGPVPPTDIWSPSSIFRVPIMSDI